MNNLEGKQNDLTNLPQTPYSKGGDNFMPEPENGEVSEQQPGEPGGEPAVSAPEENSSGSREKPPSAAWDPRNYARDSNLARIADLIEQEKSRTGELPRPEFIANVAGTLQRMMEQKTVDSRLANSLMNELINFSLESSLAEIKRIPGGEKLLEEIRKHPAANLKPEEKQARREEIIKFLRSINPHNSSLPPELLREIIEFDDVLDSLVTRIVAQPLDAETSPYSLSFYGSINMDQLKDMLKMEKEHAQGEEFTRRQTQYEKVMLAQEAMNLLHGMNAQAVTGNLEQFIDIARNILDKHFTYWERIDGVSETMRLYEQKYQEYIRRYGRLTSVTYPKLHEEVKEALTLANKAGLIGNRQLEEWELTRAMNVGRNFFNVTFRSSELIATGSVPIDKFGNVKYDLDLSAELQALTGIKNLKELENTGKYPPEKRQAVEKILADAERAGKERYSSWPLETGTRFMNWSLFVIRRFEVGQTMGGMAFLDETVKHYFEFLEYSGKKFGKNQITDFAGMNVKTFETAGLFGVTGVYSGWRLENEALKNMKVVINGREWTVRNWLAEHRLALIKPNNIKKKENGDIESTPEEVARLQEEYAQALAPLIENSNIGLGILLKQINDKELGYKARELLWRRIAEKNVPLMINYLGGLKLAEGARETIKSLEDILKSRGMTAEDEGWKTFQSKILIRHERGLKQALGKEVKALPADLELNAEEERLLTEIKTEAQKLAPHLADIVFPYTPFMNDAPFENFDYGTSGAGMYTRRMGSDFPGYHNAFQAFGKIVGNPGGIGVEEAFKQLSAIRDGLTGPNGVEDAQQRVFPMLETYLNWISTSEGKRQFVYKEIKQKLKQPTSMAQEKGGMEAESLDEFQTLKVLEKSVKDGILNPGLMEYMRKKRKLKTSNFLWAIIRDFFWVPLVSSSWDFAKETAKTK